MQEFNLKEFQSRGSIKIKLALTLWSGISWLIGSSVVPSKLRIAVLRVFGAQIARGVVLKACYVKEPWNLCIGEYSWIGRNCDFDNPGKIVIGENTCISQHCKFITGNHNYNSHNFELIVHPASIGSNCWVQAGCIFLGSFEIADSSLVNSCSIVKGKFKDE